MEGEVNKQDSDGDLNKPEPQRKTITLDKTENNKTNQHEVSQDNTQSEGVAFDKSKMSKNNARTVENVEIKKIENRENRVDISKVQDNTQSGESMEVENGKAEENTGKFSKGVETDKAPKDKNSKQIENERESQEKSLSVESTLNVACSNVVPSNIKSKASKRVATNDVPEGNTPSKVSKRVTNVNRPLGTQLKENKPNKNVAKPEVTTTTNQVEIDKVSHEVALSTEKKVHDKTHSKENKEVVNGKAQDHTSKASTGVGINKSQDNTQSGESMEVENGKAEENTGKFSKGVETDKVPKDKNSKQIENERESQEKSLSVESTLNVACSNVAPSNIKSKASKRVATNDVREGNTPSKVSKRVTNVNRPLGTQLKENKPTKNVAKPEVTTTTNQVEIDKVSHEVALSTENKVHDKTHSKENKQVENGKAQDNTSKASTGVGINKSQDNTQSGDSSIEIGNEKEFQESVESSDDDDNVAPKNIKSKVSKLVENNMVYQDKIQIIINIQTENEQVVLPEAKNTNESECAKNEVNTEKHSDIKNHQITETVRCESELCEESSQNTLAELNKNFKGSQDEIQTDVNEVSEQTLDEILDGIDLTDIMEDESEIVSEQQTSTPQLGDNKSETRSDEGTWSDDGTQANDGTQETSGMDAMTNNNKFYQKFNSYSCTCPTLYVRGFSSEEWTTLKMKDFIRNRTGVKNLWVTFIDGVTKKKGRKYNGCYLEFSSNEDLNMVIENMKDLVINNVTVLSYIFSAKMKRSMYNKINYILPCFKMRNENMPLDSDTLKGQRHNDSCSDTPENEAKRLKEAEPEPNVTINHGATSSNNVTSEQTESNQDPFCTKIIKCAVNMNYETFGLSKNLLDSLGIKPPLSKRIRVGNLNPRITKNHYDKLKEIFSLAGNVTDINLTTKKHKNFLNVQYEHPVEAVQAVSMFNKHKICGYEASVNMMQIPNKELNVLLPRGLESIGPGLGPKGLPVTNVNNKIELEPLNIGLRELSKYTTAYQFNQRSIQPIQSHGWEPPLKSISTGKKRSKNNTIDKKSSANVSRQTPNANQPNISQQIPNRNQPNRNQPNISQQIRTTNQPNVLLSMLSDQLKQDQTISKEMNTTVQELLLKLGQIVGQKSGMAPNLPIRNKDQVQNINQNMKHNQNSAAINQYTGSGQPQMNYQNPVDSGPEWNTNQQFQPVQARFAETPRAAFPYNATSQQMQLNAPPQQPTWAQRQIRMDLTWAHQQINLNAGLQQQTNLMPGLQQQIDLNAGIQQQTNLNAGIQQQTNFNARLPQQTNFNTVSQRQSSLDQLSPGFLQPEPESYRNRPPNTDNRGPYPGASYTGPKSDTLNFSSLPPSVTGKALYNKMAQVGEIVFCELIGLGRAMVRFRDERDAERCHKLFHRSKVDGQVIQVTYADL